MNSEQEKVFDAAGSATFDQLDPRLLTQENLTFRNVEGGTPLHWLGLMGQLDVIPEKILTQENLTIRDFNGITPIHEAARCGHLNQIPSKILTQENLTIRDINGITPFHRSAEKGNLHQIPRALLTKENLTIKTKSGNTPLHFATFNFSDDLPSPEQWLIFLRSKERIKELIESEIPETARVGLEKALELSSDIERKKAQLSEAIGKMGSQ